MGQERSCVMALVSRFAQTLPALQAHAGAGELAFHVRMPVQAELRVVRNVGAYLQEAWPEVAVLAIAAAVPAGHGNEDPRFDQRVAPALAGERAREGG